MNYQRWVADSVAPYLGKRILEVGAGVGSMSRWLPLRERLVLSEPDPALLELLQAELRGRFGADPRVGTAHADLAHDLPESLAQERFDTIVSFNVMEHLEDDAAAFARLAGLLRSGGGTEPRRIVSFVPAHAWALGSIDRAYGHHRRYSAASFARLAARACPEGRLETRYFNAVGLPGWLLLGKVLRRRTISTAAIRSFEVVCPWLRVPDALLHSVLRIPLGQSLIAVVTLP